MALANYADLQASVASHLHRSDLTSIIPDLITLAENRIYGDLDSRMQDTVTTLSTIAAQPYVEMPTDFINARSLTNITANPYTNLDYVSPDQFYKQYANTWSDQPQVYTIIGQKFYLAPTPDAIYSLNLVYQSKVPALSSGTNWLMTAFPSVYLYATLLAATPYLKNDVRIPVWQQLYADAIDAVNKQDWSSMATMCVRGDVRL
jgi:hypothetical protein